MKRLLTLMAVALLAASALGCRTCGSFNRGAQCSTCGQPAVGAYGGEGYLAPPSAAPETFVPAGAMPGPG